jgi:hypothetical protein
MPVNPQQPGADRAPVGQLHSGTTRRPIASAGAQPSQEEPERPYRKRARRARRHRKHSARHQGHRPAGPEPGPAAMRTGREPGAPADLGQPVGEQPAADAADDAADRQDGGERGRVDVGRQLVHARVERRLEADQRPAAHVVEGGGQRDRLRAAAGPGSSSPRKPWKLISAQPPTSLDAAASVIACARRLAVDSASPNLIGLSLSSSPGSLEADQCPAAHVVQRGGQRDRLRAAGPRSSSPRKPWKLISAQLPTSLKAAASVIACARRRALLTTGLSTRHEIRLGLGERAAPGRPATRPASARWPTCRCPSAPPPLLRRRATPPPRAPLPPAAPARMGGRSGHVRARRLARRPRVTQDAPLDTVQSLHHCFDIKEGVLACSKLGQAGAHTDYISYIVLHISVSMTALHNFY